MHSGEKISTKGHPLQSKDWAEFRTAMGVVVASVDEWFITFHKIPRTPWTIGYFPKGPIPTAILIEKLKNIGKKHNAIYIQLEPNVREDDSSSILEHSSLLPSHHPLFTKYTFILDLTKSEEEQLRLMHSKTRYNLKVAQKHGVIVEENNSDESFEQFLSLSEETTSRQGFFAHNKKYQRTMWSIMRKSKIAHLFTSRINDEILAAWIIFAYGDTIYYPYGASSRRHREAMAPTLLLWEIAKWGKKNGYKKFDLWGALKVPADPKDPWYGFHRFKEGFSPQHVEFIGSFDLILNPYLYFLYKIADTIRWKFLKLLKI